MTTGRPPITDAAEKAWDLYRLRKPHVKLAAHLGIARAAVSGWKRVPAERLEAVARFLGVPAAQLRPDLYPDPWSALSTKEKA